MRSGILERVLAAEGLNWRFEHDQVDADAAPGQTHARHKVVFFDSAAAAPGGETLRFHGVRATDTDDAIDRFAARRWVQANAVTLSSWDPTQRVTPAAEQLSHLEMGDVPSLQIYDGSAERRHADKAGAELASRSILQALEPNNKQFEGAGAVRRLAADHGFQLRQHEQFGEGADSFTTLSVEHEARNNLESALGNALSRLMQSNQASAGIIARLAGSELESGIDRNRFACVRDTVAIVPHASAARFADAPLGPQTALVVG